MTKDQAKAEASFLLGERAELTRFGLDLPPDKLQRLKSLLLQLGWTNVKLRRRKTLLRLARRLGVKRYAEPVEPTQPNAPADPFDRWRNAPPQAPKKITTALKALHEKSALIPVTDEPMPVVKKPAQQSSGVSRRRGVSDEERNVPGGFDLNSRSGMRAFREYLSNTGEDSDLDRRVQEYVDSDVDNYEPDIDPDQMRQAAEENDWTSETMAETIAEHHPEAAEAAREFHRIHSYRPRADQPNLFDPHEGQGWTPRPRDHISRFDPQDALADPDDTDYEDRLMNHLQTYHPDLDHNAINRTLGWMTRDRRRDMERARDDLYDQDRRWYAEQYDTSEIENEILGQMHDEMENEGRWEEREEEPEEPDEGWDQVRQEIAEARAAGLPLSQYHQSWADADPERAQLPAPQHIIPGEDNATPQLPAATPDAPKALPDGPQYGRWYGDHAVHTYRFKTPSGRPFSIDIGHYNHGGTKVDNLTFNDDRHSFDDTGKGEAKAVFDQVSTAVAAYMKAKKPHVLTFSAATTDGTATDGKSRQNLYAALIKHIARLDPDYAAGAVPTGGGGKNFFVFDRSKVNDVAKLVKDRLGGSSHAVEPIILKRKGERPVRFAKIDGHVQAHPLVQGFPVENALRHLANDPENHPNIRELAKVAVTGGKNGDGSNIPTALWALHDELHEHKHPAKDWYNWMSAADKIGLDAHTYRALKEESERQRYYSGTNTLIPTNDPWMHTPERQAVEAHMAMADHVKNNPHSHASIHRKAVFGRIKDRVRELAPLTPDSDIEESIGRHHWRAMKVWRGIHNVDGINNESEIEHHDLKPYKDVGGRPDYMKGAEKATRYSRSLHKLARRMGVRRYAFPATSDHETPSGLKITHRVSGGVVGIDGKPSTAHQYTIHAPNAKPVSLVLEHREGEDHAFVHWIGTEDGLKAGQNTIGPGAMREAQRAIRLRHPEVKSISGVRVGRREQAKVGLKLSRKYARATPESVKALEQQVLANPNDASLIHALADEYEESGRGGEADMLRNPEFHHLVKELTEPRGGELRMTAGSAHPNRTIIAALVGKMSKRRPVAASIIQTAVSHGVVPVLRRGWYLNDRSSIPLRGIDFARYESREPGEDRVSIRVGMPQHPMHYLNFTKDYPRDQADQIEQGLRAEGVHGHEDHEAPDAMIDVNRALADKGNKPEQMSRKGSPERYQMVAGDFLGALQRIRSSDQQAIRKSMEEIAAKLGAKPASTVDALHDSPHYSVPGVAMAIYSNLSPEKVQALAAWGALTQNTPGNAVFHIRPDGPDLLHRFRMQGSGHELRNRLDKAGLDNRILVPHKTGFDVMIPDKGGAYRDRVKGFVQQQKSELQSSRGHFRTIGSADQSRAREMFRDAITKQEHAETPVRKSEGGSSPADPGPSLPQPPAAGPGAGADVPQNPVYRASRLRRMMERIKRN